MLSPTNSTYKTADGSVIFAQYWKPEPLRAAVIQIHGLGEHSGRYQHVADAFAERGIGLLAYDHAGHGQSSGSRGHVDGYKKLMDEVDLAMGKAKTVFPGVPIFLYGHSWGGNIGINFILRRRPTIQGAIITGPWLKLPTEPPALQVTLGRILKGIFPGFSQKTGLDSNMLSHDPAVNELYRKDPLVHGKISALNYFDSADAAEYALHHASSFDCPTLLMHGGEDAITSPEGSKKFAAKAHNVRLKIWDGLYHEIHNEPSKAEVIGEMIHFIESHL
jgi:alpha-beta hydrolase superfamily lysophospholipase